LLAVVVVVVVVVVCPLVSFFPHFVDLLLENG
jgi:hypothetical protein